MRYNAFISYSHKDCGSIAPAIQKALENIGKPWYRLKRNLTVFRDETNLAASPELWNSIVTALDNSDNLILLASPIAQNSFWVNKEIEYWFSKSRPGSLYIILCQGQIIWADSNDDFDWNKTDSLPVQLKGKFNWEPLWINLTQYKTSNYKEAGFTSAITKVIGGITGKPPREIESDELKRKRKTTAALIMSSLIFLFLLTTGGLLFTRLRAESEISAERQKSSFANNLIAEAAKYKETDIGKCLLLYAYAYKINNDSSTFNILNQFYNQNIISDTYSNERGDYEPVTTRVNTFIDRIKEEEPAIDYKDGIRNFPESSLLNVNDTALNSKRQRIDLLLNINAYYKLTQKYIQFFNLDDNKELYKVDINTDSLIDYFSVPRSDYIVFVFPENLKIYNTLTKKFYSINKKMFDKAEHENIGLYNISLSSSGELLCLVRHPSLSQENPNPVTLDIYNLKTNTQYHTTLSFGKYNKDVRDFSEIGESLISNDGHYLFIKFTASGIPFTNLSMLCDLKKPGRIASIHYNSMTSVKDDVTGETFIDSLSYFIRSTQFSGVKISLTDHLFNTVPDDYYSDKIVENLYTKITSMYPYIFTGSDDGKLTIYFIGMLQQNLSSWTFSFETKNTINVKSNRAIKSLDFNKQNHLYFTNEYGEIYRLRIDNIITLERNPLTIVEQVINKIGIQDLPEEYKRFLNLEKN